MSIHSGITIDQSCFTALDQIRSGRGAGRPKFAIYKISDDDKTVVLEDVSSEPDFKVFREKVSTAKDRTGNVAPRLAVYDVDYDLGTEGKRTKSVFIIWIPEQAPIKSRMMYASMADPLKKALHIGLFVHADNTGELEWANIVSAASGGKVQA